MSLLSLALVCALAAPARADLDPIARFVAAAGALASDGETGPLTNDTHYYASNERDLDRIAPHVRDLGGALVAVAADPAYILAAWADPAVLVLVDLDPSIVALHRIYAAFFAHAVGPAEFHRLWSAEGAAEARALLAALPDAAALLALYADASPSIARRFADLQRRWAAADVAWLLSDPALYARVAALVRAGKVVALRGDFTRDGAVAQIGAALRAADLRVGLLYLSNIEQYFMYTPDFRANVEALPLHDAQVLRTLPGRPAGFQYILQRGEHFQQWAAAPSVRSVYRIRGLRKGEHLPGRTVHVVDPARTPP